LPAVAQEKSFLGRLEMFLAALLISLFSSSAFALCAYFFKHHRTWSETNFGLYYLELLACQGLGVAAHFLIVVIVNRFGFEFKIDFDFIIAPALFLWSSVLVLLVFALMHFAERNVLERLSNARQLNQQLQKARLDMLLLEEDLRKQTATFLHDRVQSQITIAAMNLATVQAQVAPQTAAAISEVRGHLEKIRRIDLKTVSQSLSPNIEVLGLNNAVHEFVNQLDRKMLFLIQIKDEYFENSPQLALGAFRIIEQAVINSVTHGPAKNVQIKTIKDPQGTLEISIEDDGPGANPSETASGVGTTVIDSWVSILKGTKSVESSPGNGYKLSVLAPL
jgi:signal transduction histidine kinase